MMRFNLTEQGTLLEDDNGRYVRYADVDVLRSRPRGYRARSEEILVIVSEHDTDDPLLSSGAIIMEQYTANSPDQVMDRAKMFADGGKYGRIWVGRIEQLTRVPPMTCVPVQAE